MNLLSHCILAFTFAPGTLNPLPAENVVSQIQYQVGNSNQEQQAGKNAFLSKMLQFNTYEQRQFYLQQAGGNGGVIGANTTYYSILNLPWSKMCDNMYKQLPLDTRMLSSNINIPIGMFSRMYMIWVSSS